MIHSTTKDSCCVEKDFCVGLYKTRKVGSEYEYSKYDLFRLFCFDLVYFNNYRPQRSCEGYVLTRVCHSVHGGEGGGCYPSMHCRWYPSMPFSGGSAAGGGSASGGCLLRGVAAPGGVCSGGVPALGGVCCGGGSAPGEGCGDPPKSRWLLATHPTGMHSCSHLSLFNLMT